MGLNNHPVWNVYDLYRTTRLNIKYLKRRIIKTKRYNLIVELAIALTASSTVASFWFFQNEIGQFIWKTLSAITALLAVIKPFLKFTEKIRKMEEMLTGYKSLHQNLDRIITLINHKKIYDEELKEIFFEYKKDLDKLITDYKDEYEDKKLINKCYEEILKELPTDSFYIPEE